TAVRGWVGDGAEPGGSPCARSGGCQGRHSRERAAQWWTGSRPSCGAWRSRERPKECAMTEQDKDKTWYEEFTVSGSELLERVKELIREGNVRRVFIKKSDGETLFEIPLTAGVAITALTAAVAPALVAVGAVAALLTQVTLGVERRGEPTDAPVED